MLTVNPSKYWCFTLNNYIKDDIDIICTICAENIGIEYIFQEEIGEKGTPHLQGYIKFNKRARPKTYFHYNDKIHWEKCRNPKASIEYCKKEDTRKPNTNYYTNIEFDEELILLKEEEMYEWEKYVLRLIDSKADRRTIHWFYSIEGNTGKSTFCEYLHGCNKYDCLCLNGKAADMKYAISVRHQKKQIKSKTVFILDYPRQSQDYVSYSGIEEIKNGLFFSTKYESNAIQYNRPHVICFSNQMPELNQLSRDRWNIVRINVDGSFTIREMF